MGNVAIESIAEKIVSKLIQRSRQLLLVYSGSPLGLSEIHPQLKRLHDEGYSFSLYASEAARQILDIPRICRELGAADDGAEGNYKRFLSQGTAILIPALTQNTAAKLALGINDTPLVNIISGGLFRGYEVVASTEGCCPASPSRRQLGLNRMTPAYRDLLAGHLKILQDFGMRLCAPAAFYDTVRDAARLRMVRVEKPRQERLQCDPPAPISTPFSAPRPEALTGSTLARSQVFTLADVITVKRGASLELPMNALLTPAAREHVKDLQITIVRRG